MKRSCLVFEEEGKKRKISEIEIGIGAKSKISVSVFLFSFLMFNRKWSEVLQRRQIKSLCVNLTPSDGMA